MTESSKNKILNKIAAVRSTRTASIYVDSIEKKGIYRAIEPDALTCFKNELEAVNGECILCENKTELIEKIKNIIVEKKIKSIFCRENKLSAILSDHNISSTNKQTDFESMQAGITSCEFLIARTGSILVTSGSESGRQMIAFPPIHIVIANENQLLAYPEDALMAIQEKHKNKLPSAITTITGPSRTADIEKTLVLGAHGPKELIVLLLRS